jgi:DNA-binding Xre family transcriptional regulator
MAVESLASNGGTTFFIEGGNAMTKLCDAARIKLELWQRKVTQRELADYIGIAPSTLSDMLNGRKPLTADRLAQINNFLATKAG